MPDITTSSWFPVVTLLLGYAAKSLDEWLGYRRNARREREAREAVRRDQVFERRTSFQRQTLLDLQEAAMQLARSVGAINHQDKLAYNSTGEWSKQQLPDDLSEGNRLAQARTGMLGARVRDDSIRELLAKLKTHSQETISSPSREDSERALKSMALAHDELNQHIGEVLRKLDDEQDGDRPLPRRVLPTLRAPEFT
jgi:hypothetical protein